MVLPEVGVRGEQGIGRTDRSRRGQGNPNKHISHYCSFKTGTVGGFNFILFLEFQWESHGE